ncbi:hypothetical protein [Bacillus paramycoides]|uniref:hypothetical protein n=1 Tax=Bacillus paramycoides TaxID=2026194 RepID=UPI002E21E285|nr:hypothetical protein [Bacillus paramycoides]
MSGFGWSLVFCVLWESRWFLLAFLLPTFLIGLGTGWFIWGTASILEKNHAKSIQDFIQFFG